MPTISFMMVCTGFSMMTTGTPVPGTTAPGHLWIRGLCRCSSCVSPCTTTGSLLCTFTGGGRMLRPAGVSTGATDGSSVEADGTGGIADLLRRLHRCLPTSDSIQETGIPAGWSSSRRCAAGITVTSRVTRQSASTLSGRQNKERPHLLGGKGWKSRGR